MEKGLFGGKTNEQLLDLFVKSRIREFTGQDQPEIYLSNPPGKKTKGYQTWRAAWLEIAEKILGKNCSGYIVADHTTEWDYEQDFHNKENKTACDYLAWFLHCEQDAKVYKFWREGKNPWFLAKLRIDGNCKFVLIGSQSPCELTAVETMDHCLAIWRGEETGDSEGNRIRLLRTLEQKINQQKKEASDDFSNACAVSSDGSKIVVAKQVVVMKDGETKGIIYPSSAFQKNKIERSEMTLRYTQHSRECPASMIADGRLDAAFVSNDKDTLYLVHQKLCPDPLPKGGKPVIFNEQGMWIKS